MKRSKEDYIRYRFKRASQTLEDAKYLAETERWNSVVNRLYYACFYAVLALFAKYDIISHTHSGVRTQLSMHFVKNGRLDKEHAMLYSDLFDLRQKGDYGDFIEFDDMYVRSLIPKTEEFIKAVENLIY